MLRSAFARIESRSRAEAIQQALPGIRSSLAADPGGPERFGSLRAIELTAGMLRQAVSPRLSGHLTNFALPLAARRRLDAAGFLREAGNTKASTLLANEARLFGATQYPAAQGRWAEVGSALNEIVRLERELIASI